MEERIIKLHKEGLSARAIGRKLGIDYHKVCDLLNAKGFTLRLSNRQKAELYRNSVNWEELIKEYEEGKSLTRIGEAHGLSYDVVRNNFIRLGVKIRSVRESRKLSREYNHRNIFKPLSAEGAYLLGWILADGSIGSKSSTIKIGLGKKDLKHLEYLRDLFTDVPITEQKLSHEFVVCSVDVYEALKELGVRPRKSFSDYDINWDKIPAQFYPHLLLGLFEGDGSISKTKTDMSFLLPSRLWESIKERVFDPLGISESNGLNVKAVKGNKYGLLNIRLRGSAYYVLGDWLYFNTLEVRPLQRKYERFKNNVDRVSNSKSTYKQFAKAVKCVVKV